MTSQLATWLSRPGQMRPRLSTAAIVVMLLPALAGCAGQQEQRSAQNLCARYQQLGQRISALTSPDVGTASAEAIQARADAALERLDQVQAVSEGQYDTLISALRTTVNDIKQSAVDLGDSFAAARQERQDAVQRLAQNLGPLKQRLDEQCRPAG